MSNSTGIKQAGDNLNPTVDEFNDDFTPNNAETAIENTAQAITDTGETSQAPFSEKIGAFKEKVSDNLSDIAEKVHVRSDTAQNYLFEKSDKVNSYAHNTIEAANQVGHRAGDALNASSGYIRNFDLAETRQQVMDTIKQRPEVSIAVAGVFGLLIGLLIGRSSK